MLLPSVTRVHASGLAVLAEAAVGPAPAAVAGIKRGRADDDDSVSVGEPPEVKRGRPDLRRPPMQSFPVSPRPAGRRHARASAAASDTAQSKGGALLNLCTGACHSLSPSPPFCLSPPPPLALRAMFNWSSASTFASRSPIELEAHRHYDSDEDASAAITVTQGLAVGGGGSGDFLATALGGMALSPSGVGHTRSAASAAGAQAPYGAGARAAGRQQVVARDLYSEIEADLMGGEDGDDADELM